MPIALLRLLLLMMMMTVVGVIHEHAERKSILYIMKVDRRTITILEILVSPTAIISIGGDTSEWNPSRMEDSHLSLKKAHDYLVAVKVKYDLVPWKWMWFS